MDKLVQRNPKAAAAHFDRALYLFDKNEHAEALNESLKSLELKPDNSDALLLSARCYLALREVQKCREYAARGMKLYPNDCNVYLNMVNLETATEHVDKAIAVVRQGLSVLHQEPALLWTLANLLIDANQLKEAESTLEEMHKINYPRWGIQYLAARMEMVQGHWRAAREGFEKVRGYLAAPGLQPYLKQVDLWLADCYSQLGNRDQQIDALRRAVRTDPFSAIARANLAQALLSAGSVDEATKEYRDLMAMSRMGAPRSAGAGPPAGLQELPAAASRAGLGNGGEGPWHRGKVFAGLRGDRHSARGGPGGAKPFGRRGRGAAESPQQGPQGSRALSHPDRFGRAPTRLEKGGATAG